MTLYILGHLQFTYLLEYTKPSVLRKFIITNLSRSAVDHVSSDCVIGAKVKGQRSRFKGAMKLN